MDISQDKRLAVEKSLSEDGTGGPVVLPFSFLEAITQNFSDEQLISRGGFGAVYKGQLQNGMVVAVKKLHNRIEILEENFKREVSCLIEAKHKNIVRFLGYCYQTQHTRKQFEGRFVWADERQMLFCFEYLSKGNLSDHLTEPSTGLQWKVRYQIIKGICEGVNYLHQQRIIHMDLKPQNILLDDSMVPKIVDFGLSRRLSESQSRTITEHIVGTPGYMAPEFLRSQTVTFKTDIYSLGVIIIEILMGYKEYSNVDKVLQSWTNTSVKSECHPRLLEQVKVCADIGIKCMDDNPGNRPAIEDIIHILDETDLSISSRDSSRFVPQPANRSLWRFHGKVLKNVNAGLWMNRLASLYFFVKSVGSTSSAGQLVDEPESTTVFSALSQLEEPDLTPVVSASSQREQPVFDRFYQHYRLAKRACKPMRISAYTAPTETTTEPSPGLNETEQLDVHPLELCFSLDANKPIKCSLKLVNRTDRDVTCLIIPQFPDMYAYTDELRYYRLYLDPMSAGILNVTMVQQEQPPVNTGMFLILMIAMGTKSDDIEDLLSSVDYDFLPKIEDDLLKRLEELGGEMHAASVSTAVACPPRDARIPTIVSSVNLEFVEAIDVHPERSWILVGHDKYVSIWHYQVRLVFASEVDEGATSVVFISRKRSFVVGHGKEWFAVGDRCGDIHVYDSLTMKEIKKFKANGGSPVLSLAVHPTHPYLVSACYSGVIKLWNWELDFRNIGSFENNSTGGWVLAKFNPNLKDINTFTSGNEHGELKVWSYDHHYSLVLIRTIQLNSTGLFDHVITETGRSLVVMVCNNGLNIWDLQTGECVQTLHGTRGFIGALSCHPTLPLIVAGIMPNDFDTPVIHFWNSTNYRLKKTIDCTYGSRIRNLGFVGSKRLVIGTDEGIQVMEIDMNSLAC